MVCSYSNSRTGFGMFQTHDVSDNGAKSEGGDALLCLPILEIVFS